MLRPQQGSKDDVSTITPKGGPSGVYSFQNDSILPARVGLSCPQDSRACSSWALLLFLGFTTAFLLFEVANRPWPAQHWSSACGKACQQLHHSEDMAASCQPPLVDEDRLRSANAVYDDQCHVLQKTCLDQGSVVVFDEKFDPEKPGYQKLPTLDMSNIMYNFPSRQGNGDALGSDMNRMRFPDIAIRPGTYLDSHLSSQPFSRCTVPVVLVTNWVTTYGEVIVRVPPRAFGWKGQEAVGGNISYVIATPGGMGLPAFYAPMLAPATSLAVTSLAGFSARQPVGTPSGATNEGLSQQCFDRVVLCKIASAHFGTMFAVGQTTYAHYAMEGLPADPAGFQPAGVSRPSFSGVASFLSKQGTLEPHEGQLRVLIEQRTGEVRNMLQLDELLSQCNAAQSLVSNSQYSCRPFTFGGDLKRNIAAVRSANVLVTLHGSGSNNAIFMAEGSTLVEIRPYQFGTKSHEWANTFMPQVTEQNDYRIRYIGLNIEDPSLSEPGKFEAMEIGNPDESTHRRDRHVRLRWEVLEQVLQLIEGCESLEDYKQLVHEGGYILNVLPGGVLEPWKGVDPGIVDGSATLEASENLLTTVPHGPVLNSTVAFID